MHLGVAKVIRVDEACCCLYFSRCHGDYLKYK